MCKLTFEDLRLDRGPHGTIRWPAKTDKIGRETVIPISATVRRALDRILRERPGIGAAPLFPSPGDAQKPISRHLADRWLREAERLAKLEPQQGSLWHAYRRKWATERKHHPDVDVAAAGGWKTPKTRIRRRMPRLCYASSRSPESCARRAEMGLNVHTTCTPRRVHREGIGRERRSDGTK